MSLSCVRLFVTSWTVAYQDPLSMRILQVRILEWSAMPSSRGPSQPKDQTHVSCIAGRFFTRWATRDRIQAYNLMIGKSFLIFVPIIRDLNQMGPTYQFPRILWFLGQSIGLYIILHPRKLINSESQSQASTIYSSSHSLCVQKVGLDPGVL